MRAFCLACLLTLTALAPAAADYAGGLKAYQNGNYKWAFHQWLAVAKKGDVDAQHNIAVMYQKGQGVPQDYPQAVRWYTRAAERGHATAQHNLAVMHQNGEGVLKDDGPAAKWYARAAKQGDLDAQLMTAYFYQTGRGVEKDLVEAHKWYNIAAARGNKDAVQRRNKLSKKMQRPDINRAQQMARSWKPKKEKPN